MSDHILQLPGGGAVLARGKVLQRYVDHVQGLAKVMAGRGDQFGFSPAFIPGCLVQSIQQLTIQEVCTVTVLAGPGAHHANDVGRGQKEQIGGEGGAGHAVQQLDHQYGVIEAIDRKTSNKPKSQQLADALKANVPIIVVTIQTFPYAMEAIITEQTLKDRKFAVVIDEAHTSQTGSTAQGLRAALSLDEKTKLEEMTVGFGQMPFLDQPFDLGDLGGQPLRRLVDRLRRLYGGSFFCS